MLRMKSEVEFWNSFGSDFNPENRSRDESYFLATLDEEKRNLFFQFLDPILLKNDGISHMKSRKNFYQDEPID